jgi:hypothetical protein
VIATTLLMPTFYTITFFYLIQHQMYKISHIQNTSSYPGNAAPTIVIAVGDDGWEEAYKNWIEGKPPTSSPEWKKGIFAGYTIQRTIADDQ